MADVKLVIADGQILFAEVLAVALEDESGLVIWKEYPSSVAEAVETVEAARPDVVILDFWLPEQGGLAAAAQIRDRVPETKILFLSWEYSAEHIVQALDIGAVGFLPKSLSVQEISEAVNRGYLGEVPVFAEKLADLMAKLRLRGEISDDVAARLASLTPREVQVLSLLAIGYPPEEVGKKLKVAKRTLNNHIHNILVKTGTGSQIEAVALARSSGIVGPSPSTQG